MTEEQIIDKYLESTLENNSYINFALLPFKYSAFLKNPLIIDQVKVILNADESAKEREKNNLQTIIYTELYKLNLKIEDIKEYFQKAILTDRYKNYLGMAFKFAIQYNPDEDPYKATFIHLAQLQMADMCYEYLWRLEHHRA